MTLAQAIKIGKALETKCLNRNALKYDFDEIFAAYNVLHQNKSNKNAELRSFIRIAIEYAA